MKKIVLSIFALCCLALPVHAQSENFRYVPGDGFCDVTHNFLGALGGILTERWVPIHNQCYIDGEGHFGYTSQITGAFCDNTIDPPDLSLYVERIGRCVCIYGWFINPNFTGPSSCSPNPGPSVEFWTNTPVCDY